MRKLSSVVFGLPVVGEMVIPVLAGCVAIMLCVYAPLMMEVRLENIRAAEFAAKTRQEFAVIVEQGARDFEARLAPQFAHAIESH